MAKFKLAKAKRLAFTLNDKGKKSEFMLFPEKEYELPEKNKYIAGLIGQGYLVPVVTKTKPAETKNGK